MTDPAPLVVTTADLRKGDRLVGTAGLVIDGDPATDEDGDGYVLVPVVGSPEPVRFLASAGWQVLRGIRTDQPTDEETP